MTKLAIDERVYNFYDLWIKGIGTLLTVITIAVGLYQYQSTSYDNSKRDRESRIAEAKLQAATRYWEKRLDIYGKIGQAVGTIAESPAKSHEFLEAKKLFLNLYWGDAVLFEDSDSEHAMVSLKKYLEIWEPTDRESRNKLTALCLAVTRSLRASIEKARLSGALSE